MRPPRSLKCPCRISPGGIPGVRLAFRDGRNEAGRPRAEGPRTPRSVRPKTCCAPGSGPRFVALRSRWRRVERLGPGELLAEVEQRGVVGFTRREGAPPLLATVRDEQTVAWPRSRRFHVPVPPALPIGCAERNGAVTQRLEPVVICHGSSCLRGRDSAQPPARAPASSTTAKTDCMCLASRRGAYSASPHARPCSSTLPAMTLSPTTLEGAHVRLVPLRMEHAPALLPVALHEELWRWTVSQIRSAADLDRYIATALREQQVGTALPFATVNRETGMPIGSTRFGNYDEENRRVEIGWTWIAPEVQRTAMNTEAKLLMLRHAFEELQCIRVELKTDALNEKSRSAIERLGAVQEGIFRKHMITSSGRLRDTVYYSILAEEWPGVRLRLEARLVRSEEHTSELQSPCNLVCRLLLEKKT